MSERTCESCEYKGQKHPRFPCENCGEPFSEWKLSSAILRTQRDRLLKVSREMAEELLQLMDIAKASPHNACAFDWEAIHDKLSELHANYSIAAQAAIKEVEEAQNESAKES